MVKWRRDDSALPRLNPTMESVSSHQAASTVAYLQEGQRIGSPVQIPGAFEIRAHAPEGPPSPRTEVRVVAPAPAAVGTDAQHLEHEREGGGAPSQRSGSRRGTLGARLWRTVLHPMQLSDIWRRVPLPA